MGLCYILSNRWMVLYYIWLIDVWVHCIFWLVDVWVYAIFWLYNERDFFILQIQFVVGMAHAANSLYVGCPFPLWMQYALIAYGLSILGLFLNFYYHEYIMKARVCIWPPWQNIIVSLHIKVTSLRPLIWRNCIFEIPIPKNGNFETPSYNKGISVTPIV